VSGFRAQPVGNSFPVRRSDTPSGRSEAGRLLVDRYRLGEVLGRGGMAVVYRAWDQHLGRAVAVKLYMPSSDRVARLRFQEEARTLAALSHPGLVAVYDMGTDSDQPFLVLQLINGSTLRERLGSGSMPAEQVRELGARLAETLAYVHGNGVIHRDVKPANVLLDEHGQPYLADFGISVLLDGSRVTATGEFVGTAGYLAPEQVLGAEATTAVDVYALGLVLLECLTGHSEYTGTDLEAAIARLRRAPVIPDSVPADLATVIGLMTAREPGRRPSAQRCAELLRNPSLLEQTSSFLPFLRVVAGSGGRRRRLSVLAAASAAAVAVLGWALLGAAQPATPARATLGGLAPAPSSSSVSSSAGVGAPQLQLITEVVTVVSTTVVTVPALAPADAAPDAGQPPERYAQQRDSVSDGDSDNAKDDSDDSSDDKSHDNSGDKSDGDSDGGNGKGKGSDG
jgi:serine/threonine protein kinase